VIIEDVIKEEKERKGGGSIMSTLGNPFDLAYEVITDEAEFAVFSEQIYERVCSTLDEEGITCFENIIENKTREEYVNVFISLLQLVGNGRVNVWQDIFFGEIFIRLEENGTESEEAG
jgi:chromatin segregation and condensation protein Rec8/ScpA/Scc1 (kleisin family)